VSARSAHTRNTYVRTECSDAGVSMECSEELALEAWALSAKVHTTDTNAGAGSVGHTPDRSKSALALQLEMGRCSLSLRRFSLLQLG
jgi:hypothetical protein